MENYKNVTHCLFDMDGLLLDTEQLYTQAFNEVLSEFGDDKKFGWNEKSMMMGLQWHESCQFLIDKYDLSLTPELLSEKLRPVYERLFPQSQLLPDSESVYKTIYNNIVSEYGHKYGGDVAYAVLGRPEMVGFEIIISHFKLPITIQEFQQKYHKMQHELFDDVRVMPGAEQLLRHLHKHKIPFALATSSSAASYELKTKQVKPLFEIFHHRVLGGSDPDVKNGKPAPDIFLVAASRFSDNPDPSKCLVFEDAPNGVQAAVSAGMQVCMVPDEQLPKDLTKKATKVMNSLLDFKPEEFGLPPFDD